MEEAGRRSGSSPFFIFNHTNPATGFLARLLLYLPDYLMK